MIWTVVVMGMDIGFRGRVIVLIGKIMRMIIRLDYRDLIGVVGPVIIRLG